MNIFLRLSASFLLISVMTPTVADDHMKPGLWEITHQGDMNVGGATMKMPDANQMQVMMKTLSPEAQAKMQKYMNNNNTVAPSANGMKICISPEQAARNDFPTNPNSQCKVTGNTRTGNTINVKMQCASGEMESTVTLNNPESWTSHMKGNMQHSGEAYSMDMTANGKWVSNDCGSLKPMSAPAANAK